MSEKNWHGLQFWPPFCSYAAAARPGQRVGAITRRSALRANKGSGNFSVRSCKPDIYFVCALGVKVRNMKMDFNTGCTWHRAMNANDENL